MLSGGKDSINLLYELVVVKKLKVLAFTVNNPFETETGIAHSNIYRALEKLNCEHVFFTPNKAVYKDLMRYMLTRDPREMPIKSLRVPCLVCTAIMKLLATQLCCKMKIPYLLYCADPVQMMGTAEATIAETARLILDIFNLDVLSTLIERETLVHVLEGASDLPKIIHPYANHDDYDADRIVEKLKKLGLYEGAPRTTHCSLYTLLNYYSFVYGNSPFYAPEMALSVRLGKWAREETINFSQMYKDLLFNVATKREKSEEDKTRIRQFFQAVHTITRFDPEACIEADIRDALTFPDTLDKMGLRLEDIKRQEIPEKEMRPGSLSQHVETLQRVVQGLAVPYDKTEGEREVIEL
jgi:hypothetical protein